VKSAKCEPDESDDSDDRSTGPGESAMEFLADDNMVIGSADSLSIMSSKADSRIARVGSSEGSLVASCVPVNQSVLGIKNLDASVVVNVEELVEGPLSIGAR